MDAVDRLLSEQPQALWAQRALLGFQSLLSPSRAAPTAQRAIHLRPWGSWV